MTAPMSRLSGLLALLCSLLLVSSHGHGHHDHDHASNDHGHGYDHASNHDQDHVHGPGHNCNHDAEEQPNFAREDARRVPSPPAGAKAAMPGGTVAPVLLSTPQPMQFYLDFQDLDTDINANSVKTGQDAAAVKTFLETKLMPGAIDFFTAALKVQAANPRVIKLPQECASSWTSGDNAGKCASFRPTMTCGPGIIKPAFYGECASSLPIVSSFCSLLAITGSSISPPLSPSLLAHPLCRPLLHPPFGLLADNSYYRPHSFSPLFFPLHGTSRHRVLFGRPSLELHDHNRWQWRSRRLYSRYHGKGDLLLCDQRRCKHRHTGLRQQMLPRVSGAAGQTSCWLREFLPGHDGHQSA